MCVTAYMLQCARQCNMSLLQEVKKPHASATREVESVHSLRFTLKLDDLASRDRVIKTALHQIFKQQRVIVTDLRVPEYSNEFPFDLEIAVSGMQVPIVLSANSPVSESWNRVVVLHDRKRVVGTLKPLPCSVQRYMLETQNTVLTNLDCVGFSPDAVREHVSTHDTNGSDMLVAVTHPFFDVLWRYAWLHCMETSTHFQRTSQILCARTATHWRVPADVLMDVTARMCEEADSAGAPVDLTQSMLSIGRFDGKGWLDGLEHVETDVPLACTLVINMRVIHL